MAALARVAGVLIEVLVMLNDAAFLRQPVMLGVECSSSVRLR
jgi:hypothetical protein